MVFHAKYPFGNTLSSYEAANLEIAKRGKKVLECIRPL